ncbi:unnamed protein product [Paramecium octaurelia]|uniref:Uncharacterized protein n=1 Tax=Paramecium octaurelia TaxID=43137 RepID=A0A8S1W372_PAROT|nr:unnamed protein product [Paramecium octaurelia]
MGDRIEEGAVKGAFRRSVDGKRDWEGKQLIRQNFMFVIAANWREMNGFQRGRSCWNVLWIFLY